MRKSLAYLFILSSICARAYAQEFESSLREYDLIGFRSLGAGAAVNLFEPRSDNALPDSMAIKFSSPTFFLEYRQMNIRLAVAYNHYSLRDAGKSSYAIYADGSTDVPVAVKRSGGLFLPIFLATNYVRAEGLGNSSGIFDVGSIGIGTGLKYRFLSERFGLQISGGALIHYATVGFSIENGTSTAWRGEVQFLLPELLWNGVTIGYRIDEQQWRMSEAKYNYKRLQHGAFVGLLF
ncbi:MAG TPA: hypothetical protein VK470_14715 [Bacteroidota bacterium]|nr:hypothetical protein [Bacteroidota bacterium]